MERRTALLAAAATTIAGTGSMIALAAIGGFGLLGFGSAYGSPEAATATPASVTSPSVTTTTQPPQVVTQFRDQYDQIVVHVPEPASEPAADDTPAPSPSPSSPESVASPT